MELTPKANCPLDGFNPCRQLDCAWFTKIQGKNPNTGKDVEEWSCAVAWLPLLLINTAKESRETAAAVESFRNEMSENNKQSMGILLTAAAQTQRRIGS